MHTATNVVFNMWVMWGNYQQNIKSFGPQALYQQKLVQIISFLECGQAFLTRPPTIFSYLDENTSVIFFLGMKTQNFSTPGGSMTKSNVLDSPIACEEPQVS